MNFMRTGDFCGPLEDRFWAKVQRGGPDDCWLWLAGTFYRGYGQIRVGLPGERVQKRSAHRVSWELAHGPIPEGLFVCHACDTPACVNPAHLFLGTNADNVADMFAKGRNRTNPPRGETHSSAVLTEAQAREILERYAAAPKKFGLQRQFGREYGVNSRTINVLVKRHTWKHLT